MRRLLTFEPYKLRKMILNDNTTLINSMLMRLLGYDDHVLHRFRYTGTYGQTIAYFSTPSFIRRACSLVSLLNFAANLSVWKLSAILQWTSYDRSWSSFGVIPLCHRWSDGRSLSQLIHRNALQVILTRCNKRSNCARTLR